MHNWIGHGVLRTFSFPLLTSVAFGCADCEFEANQIERFLGAPINQVCSSDSDCVVEVVANCLEIDSAFCGQITLNRTAAQSAHWQDLKADAQDCNIGSCAQCGALRIAKCTDGTCFR